MRKLIPFLLLATTLQSCEAVAKGVLGLSAGLLGLFVVLYLVTIGYALYRLFNSSHTMAGKIIWGLIIFAAPFLGAAAYIFLGEKMGFDNIS